jgi:hypothetical protein
MMYGAKTSVTLVAKTSVTPRAKVADHREEAGKDAVEAGGRGGPALAVCDSGGERQGTDEQLVPRIRNCAAHGLSLARALPGGGKFHRRAGAQPSAPAQSAAHRRGKAAAGGELAAADGLGSEETAGGAAGAGGNGPAAADDSSHSEAARASEPRGPRCGVLRRVKRSANDARRLPKPAFQG